MNFKIFFVWVLNQLLTYILKYVLLSYLFRFLTWMADLKMEYVGTCQKSDTYRGFRLNSKCQSVQQSK